MRLDLMARTACLALMLGASACARNKTNDQVGAAQDSTNAAARSDTTTDQTQSGVTDTSGQSTLGKDVQKTRPDQGQPVTSKGDTINPGVDGRQGEDTSSMRPAMDTTSAHPGMDTTGMHGMDSTRMHQGMDSTNMQGMDTTSMQGMDSTHIRQGMDSTGTQR
jgi:hypothetical protein